MTALHVLGVGTESTNSNIKSLTKLFLGRASPQASLSMYHGTFACTDCEAKL